MSDKKPNFISMPFPNVAFSSERAHKNARIVAMDSAPYPAVEGSPDPETVAMLKEDYTGVAGEITGVLQYIYQNTVAESIDPSFSNAMLQIAIVEMTHLDMLADAIKTLGGDPTYICGDTPWISTNVNYSDTMTDMLKADIAAESTAITNYEKHAALTKNDSVRQFLQRIIEDEKLHLAFFSNALKEVENQARTTQWERKPFT